MKLGKRFIFGIVAIICVSVTACLLDYPPEAYYSLVFTITGLFVAGQTLTDIKKKGTE